MTWNTEKWDYPHCEGEQTEGQWKSCEGWLALTHIATQQHGCNKAPDFTDTGWGLACPPTDVCCLCRRAVRCGVWECAKLSVLSGSDIINWKSYPWALSSWSLSLLGFRVSEHLVSRTPDSQTSKMAPFGHWSSSPWCRMPLCFHTSWNEKWCEDPQRRFSLLYLKINTESSQLLYAGHHH